MLNRVELIGRLGADPELKTIPTGKSVCEFRMATTEHWKDKGSGAKQEATEWHRVKVWGDLAEVVARSLNKGSLCRVEGKITTRTWDDKAGAKHYMTEIVAREVLFLEPKRAKGDTAAVENAPGNTGDPGPSEDDSIPF